MAHGNTISEVPTAQTVLVSGWKLFLALSPPFTNKRKKKILNAHRSAQTCILKHAVGNNCFINLHWRVDVPAVPWKLGVRFVLCFSNPPFHSCMIDESLAPFHGKCCSVLLFTRNEFKISRQKGMFLTW